MASSGAGVRNRWDKRGPDDKAVGAVTAEAVVAVAAEAVKTAEAVGAVTAEAVTSSNGGESPKRTAEKRPADDSDESDEDSVAQPAAPKLSKIGFAVGGKAVQSQPVKPQAAKVQAGISIKLAANKPKEAAPVVPKVHTVASVFNEDDSEPEEMPPEAKMRMKNIGRDTPTSAGPNSFNKGKHGFSDNQKLWERNIKSRLGGEHRHHNDHD
ncbi:PEST proteolytic signal-containing nuclear protein [Lissotriton helveticus]